MRLEITVDESILEDLFVPNPNDNEQFNRVDRLRRHTLVGSKELWREWEKLEESSIFQNNPALLQFFQEWVVNIPTNPSYKSVVVPETSKVHGDPTDKERAVLATAYESQDKIVVGDYSDALRRANHELRFVPKDSFSTERPGSITLRDIEGVLDGPSNLKRKLFAIFETPIELSVPENGDAELLARYLAHFYDEKMVIQDKFFLENDQNEANFVTHVLEKLPDKSKSEIELRVMVNQKLSAKGATIKKKYECRTDCKITVKCIQETRENLHSGYIESSRYRIGVEYRLFVFGRNNKTVGDTIRIRRK